MDSFSSKTSGEQDEKDSCDIEKGLQVELVAPGINEVPEPSGNGEANDAAKDNFAT
jgi:hypothetical protein